MSNTVKIVVTAETAQAAAALQAFVQTQGSGLKQLAARGAESAVALRQVRETAMLTHEGLRGLEGTVFLLGGTRFPELTMGVMTAVQGMKALRTSAMLTGASMATVLPVVGVIAAGVAAGVIVWKQFSSAEEQAAKQAKDLEDALGKIPEQLTRIRDLMKAGALGPGAAGEFSDYITGKKKLYVNSKGDVTPQSTETVEMQMPTGSGGAGLYGGFQGGTSSNFVTRNLLEASLGQAQKYVSDILAGKAGMNDPRATEALRSLEEMEKKFHIESLEGLEKEKAEIQDKYQKQRDEIKATIVAAGPLMTPTKQAAADSALADINKSEAQALEAAKAKQAEKDVEFEKLVSGYFREEAEIEDEITQQLIKQSQIRQEIARAQVEAKLTTIQGNPLLSDQQKAQQSVPLYNLLIQENAARIRSLQLTTEQTNNESVRLEAQKQMTDLMKQQSELQNNLTKAQDQNSFSDQMKVQGAQVASQWGNLSKSLANGAFKTIQQGISGMANALTSLIMGTETAGQAFAQFGMSVLSSFIEMILEAILWAKLAIPILTYLGVVSGGTTAATGSAVTIASVGAAMAAVPFKKGGYTGDGSPDDLAGIVHRGEYVFPASAVDRIGVDSLAALHRGHGGSGGGGASGGAGSQIHIVVVNDKTEMLEAIKSAGGEQAVVAHVVKNRRKVGIRT